MSSAEVLAPINDNISYLSNAANFGLSKHLAIPISIKICYLRPTTLYPHKIASSSTKYRDASVFQKLLDISVNSDLFVSVQAFDQTHNALSLPVQTPYKAFSNNKRVWNTYVKLPVNFNQVSYGAYIQFTLFEIVQTTAAVFGVGRLSLFNHTNGTLRKGSQKVDIGPKTVQVDYSDFEGMTELEKSVVAYENGEFTRSSWLDSLTMPLVDKLQAQASFPVKPVSKEDKPSASLYQLYIELPNFSLPIVYLDITFSLPNVLFLNDYMDPAASGPPNATVIMNSISIDPLGGQDLVKVYDPDFDAQTIQKFNTIEFPETPAALSRGTGPAVSALEESDPIERKFQTLATNINNTSLLDNEVKPSPHMRDELWKILKMPSSGILSDHEKTLLWKFRFYFSKNPDDLAAAAPLQTNKHFLTKFFKCFNWENEYELDHAFQEIFPLWSVETIEIGDALELLSNNFDPYTLTAALRRRMVANINAKDINTNEEKKIEKIFSYSKKLRMFAVDRIRLASDDELLLYLLQLVQALKYESLLTVKNEPLSEAPLAKFLIERSVESGSLGNFFYWYVKVENEDQLKNSEDKELGHSIYSVVLNTYIELLKQHCQATKQPQYRYLKSQIAFIKKLTSLVELLRSTFKKNEATSKKKQFLQEYLADSSNELVKFPDAFPLPLDPSVMVCGCYPAESSVFKSSLAPLKITLKTVINHKESHPQMSQIFGAKKQKYGKYALMFKIGDDLRQDQLVIQIITLMDQLLKNENLNLKLTPYKILATSPIAGLIQFVPNETLDEILAKNYETGTSTPRTGANASNGILNYLRLNSHNSAEEDPDPEDVLGASAISGAIRDHSTSVSDLGVSPGIMDNYVKSCAGYCVITYILGVGDRHLDNLLLSPNGKFWHADFGYILGRDPKPFPPLMKLPIQVIDGMGGMNHENYNLFKSYCFITYTTLRKNSNLILNLFQLMLNADIPDIQIDPKRAVEKVQEKFALEMTEEEAILHFQNLIIDSVNAVLPVVIDTLHSLAQYWRA